MPSQISPTTTSSSASAEPTGPGSRWENGRIALNRCVTYRAPAERPAAKSAAVPSVWPIDTTTPRAASSAITSVAPGSSGATVASTTPASRDQPAISSLLGSTRRSAGWAPLRAGESIGPSMCNPSGTAPGDRRASRPAHAASAARRTGSEHVITVGTNAVTP